MLRAQSIVLVPLIAASACHDSPPRASSGPQVSYTDANETTGGGADGAGAEASGGGTVQTPPSVGSSAQYSTNFDLTESPISEGGVWKHVGADWAVIKTAKGFAFGTQTGIDTGKARFSDSYAYLQGFPASVSVSTVLHKQAIAGDSHETAILLRWADEAHVARGYECGIAYNGAYGGVTRWNGALGDYTSPPGWQFSGATVHEGDILNAQIIGTVITMRLNGVVLVTVDITTAGGGAVWTDGNPGFACFRSAPSTDQSDFSITQFSAKAL